MDNIELRGERARALYLLTKYSKNPANTMAHINGLALEKVPLKPTKCIKHQGAFSSTDERSIGGHGVDPVCLPWHSQTKTNCGASYQSTPTSDQLLKINVNYSYSLHEKSIKVTGC